jgi:ribose/xylose/arabinose/galactoside ABC-type transport system permease subunit
VGHLDDDRAGVVIAYIARRLPFGRHVYAIGDNERAAELSGVKVETKVLVYTLSACARPLPGLWYRHSFWPATRRTVPPLR